MGAAPSTTSVQVHLARPVDTAAARMMLPEAFTASPAPVLFAARKVGVPSPLGVAALSCATIGRDPDGFRFALTVAPPYRGRGVGRALLEAVVAECRRWGVRGLWSWQRVADGSGADFLRALGFERVKRFLHFEADLSRLGPSIRPARDRVARTGGVPANVRVVALPEAPVDAVALLHQRHLGGDPSVLRARIAGHGPDPFCREHSHVLMAGDDVAGTILSSCDGPVSNVEAYVVDSGWRRSRAGVLLAEATLSGGLATGITHIRFACWEDVQYTMKLAARAGGRVTATEGQYVLDLEPAARRG